MYANKDITKLALDWINQDFNDPTNWPKLERLIFSKPIIALRVIEEILYILFEQETLDLNLLGYLSAGPLEELLAQHQENIIENVEILAKSDINIRKALSGVWQNAMSDEIFARVQNASEPNFKF